jgi:putative hemolysin
VANVSEPDEAEARKHEILSAALAGESQGVMDTTTVEVIKNVMQFRDVAVTEVMTQRMNIVSVDVKDDIPTLTRKATEHEFSRFPVTDGGLDKIVGILVVKDLLKAAARPGLEPRTLYRPAYFVPETKRVADLLKELRTKKVHMAFVADEYGGTAGLVTIEDVIEEIIGEIDDEHDGGGQAGEGRPLRRLSETELDIDGKLTLEELAREAGVRLSDVEEVSTLGGYIAMRLGRIPTKGDRVVASGHTFTVTDADERRARRIHVKLLPAPAHSPNE